MKWLTVFGISVAAILAVSSGKAQAQEVIQYYHATANCQPVPGVGGGTFGVNAAIQLTNTSATPNTYVEVICPLTNKYQGGLAPFATLQGWSTGSGTITAKMCHQWYGGNYPICGPVASSSGTGTVDLDVYAPSNMGEDYLFMLVTIGGTNSSTTFWGYTFGS